MIATYVRHYRDATTAYLVVQVNEVLNGVVTPTNYTGSATFASLAGSTDNQIVVALLTSCKAARDASATKTAELAPPQAALRHDQAMAMFQQTGGRDIP